MHIVTFTPCAGSETFAWCVRQHRPIGPRGPRLPIGLLTVTFSDQCERAGFDQVGKKLGFPTNPTSKVVATKMNLRHS
jgi:hypothetical protein